MSSTPQQNHPAHRVTPGRILATTIIGIILAEVVVMLLIEGIRPLPFALLVLLDALTMTVMIFPLLYLLSFRPLLSTLAERERAEKELRSAQADLELRVQE